MRKIKGFILLSIGLLIFLSACGTGGTSKISIGEVTRSVFYTPMYVAVEEGFFEEEGLEIDLQTTWGGDTTMTTLLSDGIDIALVGAETSIYVYAQDSKDYAINFAQLTQTDGTFLVAKEVKPDFTWEDLRGENFLGQRVGGMPQMVGEYVLKKHGVDPHADVNLDQSVDFANIPSAFASGDYEYVQLFEPTASVFEREGTGHIVASFGEESGTVPYTGFMAKQSYMDKNEETVLKFTKALYKAQAWVQETDAMTLAEIVSPYFEDTDIELLASSIERYKNQDSFATDPLLDKEEWEQLKTIMDEAGELPEDVPYEELVNTEFAEKVIND
ncbi:ABC transporter substrate-binding protein [Oceanobacillus caeni]|uniref:ABC transporter substrate-binding protein n=1 Tax=Oceanobacillus TaxID=182709 RepID=UPI001957919C|nr:ABC transporter substrate-binding protein [Oceanobacillus caeni]MBU8791849.1 ABC transporter substrate-binding protein [Oceanobacillus caeni]MCR1836019.1 ABC transporter substrate-binding protein [Oceanobacillus caeni]